MSEVYDKNLHAIILGAKLNYKTTRLNFLEVNIFNMMCQEEQIGKMPQEEQTMVLNQKKAWHTEYNSLLKEVNMLEVSLNQIVYTENK